MSFLCFTGAVELVESFLRFSVLETTTGVMLAAPATRRRFRISYWHAAILEAARSLGCDVVLSENLTHDEGYAGVRVENPGFRQILGLERFMASFQVGRKRGQWGSMTGVGIPKAGEAPDPVSAGSGTAP